MNGGGGRLGEGKIDVLEWYSSGAAEVKVVATSEVNVEW